MKSDGVLNKWRHRITVYSSTDILELIRRPKEDAPPSIFCDDEGACYFDAGPNPYTRAIEDLLDEEGKEGWELLQLTFRPDQLICFWRQPI